MMGRWAIVAIIAMTFVASPPSVASAQPLEEIFASANRAHFGGDYQEAARGYQRLVDSGVEDPDVYYNLGVTRMRMSQYGRAIVAFERAIWLRPGDEEARAGLEAAHGALAARRADAEGEALLVEGRSLLEAIGGSLPESVIAWSLLTLDIIAFFALAAFWRAKTESARIAFGITAAVGFVLLVGAGFALAGRTHALEEGRRAVILEDPTLVFEGPDHRAKPVTVLREGDFTRVLSAHDDYLEVHALPPSYEGAALERILAEHGYGVDDLVSNADNGWIPRESVGLLDPL